MFQEARKHELFSHEIPSGMRSAINRVLSTEELLEHILLSLPERSNGLPDFHYYVLQRVSKGFKASINGSSRIRHRMFLEGLESRPAWFKYRFTEWLSERGVLPPMPGCQPHVLHVNYLFAPQVFYLDDPVYCETGPVLEAKIGYTILRAHASRARLEKSKFVPKNATWRELPVNPSTAVNVLWDIIIIDNRGRLHNSHKKCQLDFNLYFNRLQPLGELFDLVEAIKSRTAKEHIECYSQAMRKLLQQQQERYLQLEEQDWAFHRQRTCPRSGNPLNNCTLHACNVCKSWKHANKACGSHCPRCLDAIQNDEGIARIR